MNFWDKVKNNIPDNSVLNKRLAEFKRKLFVWNIVSVAFYTAFTLILLLTEFGNSVYTWVVTAITGVYIATFALLIFISRKDSKKAKGRVKDCRSGIRILRSLLKVVPLLLNITVFMGAFGKDKGTAVGLFAYIALVVAIARIIKEIAAIVRRHKKKFKGYHGIKAVIFDLDGTLADSLRDIADAVNYGLAAAALPLHSVEEIRGFLGNGPQTLIKKAVYPYSDKFDEVYQSFAAYYEKHSLVHTLPYEGIDTLLEWLYYKGIKLAVVTNKQESAAKRICKKLFSYKLNAVIGTGDGTPPKPAADGTLKAMKLMKVSPDEVLFVGDSEVDHITAAKSGIRFIGAEWGFGTITSECYSLDIPNKIIALIEGDTHRKFALFKLGKH